MLYTIPPEHIDQLPLPQIISDMLKDYPEIIEGLQAQVGLLDSQAIETMKTAYIHLNRELLNGSIDEKIEQTILTTIQSDLGVFFTKLSQKITQNLQNATQEGEKIVAGMEINNSIIY